MHLPLFTFGMKAVGSIEVWQRSPPSLANGKFGSTARRPSGGSARSKFLRNQTQSLTAENLMPYSEAQTQAPSLGCALLRRSLRTPPNAAAGLRTEVDRKLHRDSWSAKSSSAAQVSLAPQI